VPLLLAEQDVGRLICEQLGYPEKGTVAGCHSDVIAATVPLSPKACPAEAAGRRLGDWQIIADRMDERGDTVTIAVVGKYTENPDAYVSVVKALQHAALEAGFRLSLIWVDSSALEPNMQEVDRRRSDEAWKKLRSAQGVLVPGGFGCRGIEGKIATASHCRKCSVPYLGICVGMQTAVIELARCDLGWEDANSTEFDEGTANPVVVFLPESSSTVMGGTMRLGTRATIIGDPDSLACKLYGGTPVIYERHRHRYEVNISYVPRLEAQGLRFAGQDDRRQRMELCELRGHPFYVACQFHPEFQSRPARPAPLFLGLVLAAKGCLEKRLEADGGCLRAGAGFERQ